MIGQAVYSILNSTTAITDAVNGIFPVVASQDTQPPYIIHQTVTTEPTDIKDSGSPLDNIRYQVDTYGKTKAIVDSIANSVRSALDRYSGTVATIKIDSIKFLDEHDGPYEEEVDLYRVIQEFQIRIKR